MFLGDPQFKTFIILHLPWSNKTTGNWNTCIVLSLWCHILRKYVIFNWLSNICHLPFIFSRPHIHRDEYNPKCKQHELPHLPACSRHILSRTFHSLRIFFFTHWIANAWIYNNGNWCRGSNTPKTNTDRVFWKKTDVTTFCMSPTQKLHHLLRLEWNSALRTSYQFDAFSGLWLVILKHKIEEINLIVINFPYISLIIII